MSKPRIVWLIDRNWGWSVRYKAISRKLLEYEHVPIYLDTLYFEPIEKQIEDYNPDIVMCLPANLAPRLGSLLSKTAISLTSERVLQRCRPEAKLNV